MCSRRATSATPFTFRAALMIRSRCARFSTSTSAEPVTRPSTVRSSMLLMSVPVALTAAAMSAYSPRRSLAVSGESHREALPLHLLPVDLQAALGLVRQQREVGTVAAMDAHAAAARDVADDRDHRARADSTARTAPSARRRPECARPWMSVAAGRRAARPRSASRRVGRGRGRGAGS